MATHAKSLNASFLHEKSEKAFINIQNNIILLNTVYN